MKKALGGSSGAALAGGAGIPEIPAQDFSKYGPIEMRPLSRLKKLSGTYLHRAWLNIPHVTHSDDADITDLEGYRKMLDGAAKEKGFQVTMLTFLLKASVVALKEHPDFNASLSPDKESLILKRYYHIGVAVDTPDGLVVPVIRDVDRKGILELSQELGTVSKKMREGKIAPTDIQGATFSISSLGGIGGTNFTPIVNAPELAILGVVRSLMTRLGRQGVQAAAHAAAVRFLRPPHHRRCARRALHAPACRHPSRRAPAGALSELGSKPQPADQRIMADYSLLIRPMELPFMNTQEIRVPDIGDFKEHPCHRDPCEARSDDRGRGPHRHSRKRQSDHGGAGPKRRPHH